MILPIDLDGMAIFSKIVEHGSLSAASRALNLPKATVSRRLATLERTLGSELLSRTTRSQSLTHAGRVLFERIAPLIADAEAASTEIRALSGEPSGLVRVTAPVTFGHMVLLPVVNRFLNLWPKVRIEMELSDAQASVVEEGFDIAIRIGDVADSDLVARRLMRVDVRLVASPRYIADMGRPISVDDLRRHTALVWHPSRDVWRFDRDGETVEVRVRWRLAVFGMLAIRDACREGLGIALLPSFVADPAISAGDLVSLDVGANPAAADATALYRRARHQSLAARSFLDFAAAELAPTRRTKPR